eukprot:m.56471 g.56471  ORF g.56471 m.56471 type:complete len:433 (-) comp22251_c0_seq2:52-1350(-)
MAHRVVRHVLTVFVTLSVVRSVMCTIAIVENKPRKHESFPSAAPDPRSSEANLKWYLSRAATVSGFLSCSDGRVSKNTTDTIRMVSAMGTRYAGRAAFVWGQEQNLAAMFPVIKQNAEATVALNPDIILEAAIFEIVTKAGVETIEIPRYVMTAFGEPPTSPLRNFQYESMLFPDKSHVNQWGPNASVPDMTRLETRMWFYYAGTQYMNSGIEALHCGQIMLMSANDKGMVLTYQLLSMLREYASHSARRGFVLCNAHLYQDPWVHFNFTQQLVFDLHAFPSRPTPHPEAPENCTLQQGFEDAMYLKSAGGVAVGGWTTPHLPYMVELDNYDATNHPGVQDPKDTFHPFGYDEISWFAHQPPAYRDWWLGYAASWLAQNDPAGHFEMPALRPLSDGVFSTRPNIDYYDATNTGDGFGQESAIAAIWTAQDQR